MVRFYVKKFKDFYMVAIYFNAFYFGTNLSRRIRGGAHNVLEKKSHFARKWVSFDFVLSGCLLWRDNNHFSRKNIQLIIKEKIGVNEKNNAWKLIKSENIESMTKILRIRSKLPCFLPHHCPRLGGRLSVHQPV